MLPRSGDGPTVGFDLDMTLIDPRAGMVRAFDALNDAFGLDLDGEHFAANLGPPLADVLRGYGFAEELVGRLVAHFREIYPQVVVPVTEALPGAAESLDAVRAAGGRVLVITGKYQANAALHLRALGWEADRLSGDLFAAAKGTVLREEGATIYVGDHLGDLIAADAAGATGVGVATGPYEVPALHAAGAAIALPDLTGFPGWLRDHLART